MKQEDKILPKGASVIIENQQGLVLAVSRADKNGFCLPGGKVDFGEAFSAAAVRELKEETGLVADEADLEEFHRGVCASVINYDVVVFALPYEKIKNVNELKQQEEGVSPFWTSFSSLIFTPPFSYFNKNAVINYFSHIKNKKFC